MPQVAPVFEIYGAAQSYEWGTLGKDGSKVAHFARPIPGFKYEEDKPYAEVGETKRRRRVVSRRVVVLSTLARS